MAETFAFQIAGKILGYLADESIPEIERVWSVKSDLNRLELTVSAIKSVLEDASEKKKTNRQVEDWLEKLQDVFDDADDMLDDFMTESLRRKIVIKGSKLKEVINFFSSTNPLALRVIMSRRLKKIRMRMEDIAADRRDLQLVQLGPGKTLVDPFKEQTHSYINTSDVIGRDDDEEKIVKHLLGGSSNHQDLCILPIVGIGGLGKTTLAKMVYNNEEIVEKFKTRLWVCVRQDFDLKRLVEKILKEATGGAERGPVDLNQLQVSLRKTLKSKRYLLVLDDVWNDDRIKWTNLKDLLSCGSNGSKIIVTTRKESSAKIMATSLTHRLEGLPKDKCMSIFVKCAFKEGEDKNYPKLVKIAEEIVIKCSGLPLAVKCLGSLLYTKREERDWLYIKDNDLWKVETKENGILPVLKMSYDELPLELKQCFVYCATYPKARLGGRMRDYLLIAEWIAHGYTESFNANGALEDIGGQYVHGLLSRSFFQDVDVSFDGRYTSFEMHDLLYDLASSVAGKEISHVKFDMTSTMVSQRTRHLLLCDQNIEGKEFPDFLLKLKKVRSISFGYAVGPVTKTFLKLLLKSFKCLRNLDLSGSEFEELPTSVGKLKHLRLLSISGNRKIQELPNAISNLVNLQSLYLDGCVMLQNLPRDFGNMWSLRVLSLTLQSPSFPKIGLLDALTSLQTLAISRCCNLESLSTGMKSLTSLRNLYIDDCPNLTHLSPQSMNSLISLEKLSIGRCEKLTLSEEFMDLPSSIISLSLYDMPRLKELPCGFEKAASSIKYIWIDNCPCLSILPNWLNKCTSLIKLRVENCMLLEFLPLGIDKLSELRTLRIVKCSEELRRKCEREAGEYWPWITKFSTT